MVRLAFLLALGMCLAPFPAGAAPGPVELGQRLIGRFDRSDPAGPWFAWSGSAVEVSFFGTGLAMRLNDASAGKNRYTVTVDGGSAITISVKAGAQSYVLAQSLPAANHRVVISRNTEAFFGASQLLGFDLDAGGHFLPVAPPHRGIELVGDSVTCGYGDLGSNAFCGFSAETEDHHVTYGALTGAALGADVSTICVSGRGVYRNGDGSTTFTMPILYPTSNPNNGALWDFSWIPDAVVIDLGSNDFKLGVPDRTLFMNSYRAFIDGVRARYPSALVVLAEGPMLRGERRTVLRDWLTQIAAARKSAGDARIEAVEFAQQDGSLGYGCDGHPGARTHRQMADQLTAVLKQKLGW